MKILIVSDAWHPQLNGVVRTYEHLRDEMTGRGHDVKVIGPADFPLSVPLPGYAEISLVIKPYARLKRMIEAYAPDHLHIGTEGPLGWAARRYGRSHNVPFTTAYHTHFPDYVAKRYAGGFPLLYKTIHAWGREYVRRFHAPAKGVMLATQSLEDDLKNWNFRTAMHRVSRGVDIEIFHPGERTLFAGLPRPVALYVGRIAVEKNLEDFLSMEWSGSRVLVGDGPSLSYLSNKYKDAVFTGVKTGTELAEHYRSADIFVFPSRTDTFGMVLIEALASGLPVAGYNVTGPMDIITEPFLGALHPDDLGAAARMALQTGTPEERVQHVRNHYTWKKAGEQFELALLK